MGVVALARRREQLGVAELAQSDEFVTDRCGDQPFVERVGRDGVDWTAATGVSAATGMMRLCRRSEKKHHG